MSRRVARPSWRGDHGLDRVGEGRVGRDEDRRRVRAVLGLGDEVGRHVRGIRRRCRQDHPLGRSGREVDADVAADLDLGRGDPRVARPDDPVDGLEARLGQAVRERPDGLGAAGDHEGVDLEQAGRAEQDRVRATVATGRRGDDDPADTGDLCRHDGHHERGWVRGGAAGDVGADPGERRPAALDLDAGRDGRPARDRPLGLGEAADVGDRLVERPTDVGLEPVAGVAQARPESRTRRPSARPPPTAAFASRTAASPRARTSSRMARTVARTSGSGTAPRRMSAACAERAAGSRPRPPRGRAGGAGRPPDLDRRRTGRPR